MMEEEMIIMPEVTLRNVTTTNQHPGEDRGFMAELLINGQQVGHARHLGGNEPYEYKLLDAPGAVRLVEQVEQYFESVPQRIITLSSAIAAAFVSYEMVASQFMAPNYQPEWEKDCLVVFNGQQRSFRVAQLKMSLDQCLASPFGEKMLARVLSQFVLPKTQPHDLFLTARLPPKLLAGIAAYYDNEWCSILNRRSRVSQTHIPVPARQMSSVQPKVLQSK